MALVAFDAADIAALVGGEVTADRQVRPTHEW